MTDHPDAYEPERIESGMHVSLLDPLGGAGIFVAPMWTQDVYLETEYVDSNGERMPANVGLYASDWDSMTRRLVKAGWALLTDEWDVPTVVTTTANGATVFALYPEHLEGNPEHFTEAVRVDYMCRVMALIDWHAEANSR